MSFALQRTLSPSSTNPDVSGVEGSEHDLRVVVVFTSVEATIVALRKASALANRLNARITMLVPQVVPFPLPLTSPPVLLDFSEKRFRVIAGESSVDTVVQIFLCRDKWDGLTMALRKHSLVVLGGRKRWWPTAEKRLARRLRRAGHEVIVTEME
jgi:hypothetical protein